MGNTIIQNAPCLQHCSLGRRGWRRRARGCTAAGWGGGTRPPGTASTSPDASSPCTDACRTSLKLFMCACDMKYESEYRTRAVQSARTDFYVGNHFTFTKCLHKKCVWCLNSWDGLGLHTNNQPLWLIPNKNCV